MRPLLPDPPAYSGRRSGISTDRRRRGIAGAVSGCSRTSGSRLAEDELPKSTTARIPKFPGPAPVLSINQREIDPVGADIRPQPRGRRGVGRHRKDIDRVENAEAPHDLLPEFCGADPLVRGGLPGPPVVLAQRRPAGPGAPRGPGRPPHNFTASTFLGCGLPPCGAGGFACLSVPICVRHQHNSLSRGSLGSPATALRRSLPPGSPGSPVNRSYPIA